MIVKSKLSMSEVIDLDNIRMQIHNASERVESDTSGKKARVNVTSGDENGSANAAEGSSSEKKDKKKLDPHLTCNREQRKGKAKHLKTTC